MALWFSRSPDRPKRPLVRPWALIGPILVLLIAAPLLRPLRAPGLTSDRERVALESVRAILDRKTLALDPHLATATDSIWYANGKIYSKDPPSFNAYLAAVTWCLQKTGFRFSTNPNLLNYLLIFFGITMPTAVACGLLYRTARVFELGRPWRAGLSVACVLATGWISYAVVLLPHALVASLVVIAIASIVRVAQTRRTDARLGWFFLAGFSAALAAVIEPLALWTLPVVTGSIFVLTIPLKWRIPALLLVLTAAAGPLTMHALLNRPITGDYYPPRWHATMFTQPINLPNLSDDADPIDATIWLSIGRSMNRLLFFMVGSHGILSHFPVLLIGIIGAGIILTRHWTLSLKWLAAGSIGAMAAILIYKSVVRIDDIDANFAAPRFIMVLPLLMLWSGSWIRRPHSGLVWTAAGVALGVSIVISLLGATTPAPPGGYQHFTAAEAVVRLVHPPQQVARTP